MLMLAYESNAIRSAAHLALTVSRKRPKTSPKIPARLQGRRDGRGAVQSWHVPTLVGRWREVLGAVDVVSVVGRGWGGWRGQRGRVGWDSWGGGVAERRRQSAPGTHPALTQQVFAIAIPATRRRRTFFGSREVGTSPFQAWSPCKVRTVGHGGEVAVPGWIGILPLSFCRFLALLRTFQTS